VQKVGYRTECDNDEEAYYKAGRLEANLAFEQAVASRRLSDKPSDANYLGNYMYMGKGANGRSLFKHILTRKYLD
jgi:hypothetical protein